MWHRIEEDIILESVDTLPQEISLLPPGAILNAGWRRGTASPVPFHDPAKETVESSPQYDRYSGVVTEAWAVVPRNSFELMGDAMLIRREESRQRKLKGSRY
jgi:hypothetical protein